MTRPSCEFGTAGCDRPGSVRVAATSGGRPGPRPRVMCLHHAGIMLTVVAWDNESLTVTPLVELAK